MTEKARRSFGGKARSAARASGKRHREGSGLEGPFDRGPVYTSPFEGARPETLDRFFRAAAALYRLDPWASADQSQVLQLDAPGMGHEGACVSFAGGENGRPGVDLFPSIEEYARFFLDMEGLSTDDLEAEAIVGPVLAIVYEDVNKRKKAEVEEVRRQGWEVAGKGAFPNLLAFSSEGPEYPGEVKYRYATAALEVLCAFLSRQEGIFERELMEPVVERLDLPDLPEKPTLTLTAPHPEGDWVWGEESLFDVVWRDEGAELAEEFLDQLEERSGGDQTSAGMVLDHLFEFKVGGVGEPPRDWTAKQVEAFLLEYVPAEAMLEPVDLEVVPEVLDRFFAWLAESGKEHVSAVSSIRERIAHSRAAFLRGIHDPARWGSAKRLWNEMGRAGVDRSDHAAVHRYLDELAPRTKHESPSSPAPFAGVRPIHRKAWVWTPGEPVPDPKAPCPCGSGSRYKKCCLPR